MTKKDALTIALTSLPADATEAAETIRNMIAQLSKGHNVSDEKKAEQAAARKAKTAAARAEMCSHVIPILRDVITTDMTAKDIFAAAQERLPQDFTAAKVQNILLREMKDELVKTETKGKANTYRKI